MAKCIFEAIAMSRRAGTVDSCLSWDTFSAHKSSLECSYPDIIEIMAAQVGFRSGSRSFTCSLTDYPAGLVCWLVVTYALDDD
jgi:hypothetical protein